MRRRILRERKGQATVELALVLPILLLLLVGVAQVSLLLSAYLTVEASAQEGADLAAIGGSDTAIVARVDQVASDLNAANLSVSVSPPEPRMPGTDVTVTVVYVEPITIPLVSTFLGPSITMQSSLSMQIQ